MNQRFRIAAVAALAAGLLAYLRRPAKQPEDGGTWHPAERTRTHR